MTNSNELIPINQTLTVNDLTDGWSNFCIIILSINVKNNFPTWDDCEMTIHDGNDGLIVTKYITDNENSVCLYAMENKTLMVTIGDYRLLINLLDKDNPELIKKYGKCSREAMSDICEDISGKMSEEGVYNKTEVLDKISYPVGCLDRIDNTKYKDVITHLKNDKKYKTYTEMEKSLSQIKFPTDYANAINIMCDIDEKLLDCSEFIIVAIMLKNNHVTLNVHNGDENFITPGMINNETSYHISCTNSWLLQICGSSVVDFENNHTLVIFIEKNNTFLLKTLNPYDIAKNNDSNMIDVKKFEQFLTFMVSTKTSIAMDLLRYVAYPITMLSQYVTNNQFKEILDKNSKPVSLN